MFPLKSILQHIISDVPSLKPHLPLSDCLHLTFGHNGRLSIFMPQLPEVQIWYHILFYSTVTINI